MRRALAPYEVDLWLDEVELLPGDSLFGRIGSAIDDSDRVLAFITAESLTSKWVQRELNAFLAREADSGTTMVIPVVVGDVIPPAFLGDRLQVRMGKSSFAGSVRDVLKGIFRHHGVIMLAPRQDGAFGLAPFGSDIDANRERASAGELLAVLDHEEMSGFALSALVSDGWSEKERLELAWPRVLDFFIALAPRVIQVVLEYMKRDIVAVALAESTVQVIWRLVSLTMLYHVRNQILPKPLQNAPMSIVPGLAEIELLDQSRTTGKSLGPLAEIWLSYLGARCEDCHDIGFRGAALPNGTQVFDAGHVRVRDADIRADSLSTFTDTPPEAEFTKDTWVRRIMPYIVADAIIQASYCDWSIADAVPRIGLRREDYCYFGVE
jgi:hypothetical protein